MILLTQMPCSNCGNYVGIRQPDGTEESEFIGCKVAVGNDASNLLEISGDHAECEKQKRIYEDDE